MTVPPLQPPGWYVAQGDPQGTHRWWDGAQWIGGPVAVGAPSHPGPVPQPYGYAPAPYGYGYPPRMPYAGWWLRFGAYLLDALILGVPGGIINWIARSSVPTELATCRRFDGRLAVCEQPTGTGLAIIILVGLGLGVAGIAYFVYFHGKTGQTIGKRACGIKVVDRATGRPIGTGRAIGRYFAAILSAIPCALGYLWAAWDKDKQTWHDKMVNTVVIQADS
jgi:uncharacterized RDD family membrane protein YckC